MNYSPIVLVRQPSLNLEFDCTPLEVAVTPEVLDLLGSGAVAAFGVSGGKDGAAAAIEGMKFLDRLGHTGPRVLVHADLGRVEWKDSLPQCERLAAHLGLELIVVKREAGDMMDRWQSRWTSNVLRYAELETVKLILPWSNAVWRFCTSELKTSIIERELKRRFPTHDIVNITGIRRQESSRRRVMPISKTNKGLTRKGYVGLTWNPVIEWPVEQVFATIEQAGLPLHEGYTRYQVSRISCAYCVLASFADLVASATCPDNHAIYREMVELEITSTYSFQEGQWLADIAPHLLSSDTLDRVVQAKEKANRRAALEAEIPDHLIFRDGYPIAIPTKAEAELLQNIRLEVSRLIGISLKYSDADQIIERYCALFAEKAMKDAAAARAVTH